MTNVLVEMRVIPGAVNVSFDPDVDSVYYLDRGSDLWSEIRSEYETLIQYTDEGTFDEPKLIAVDPYNNLTTVLTFTRD